MNILPVQTLFASGAVANGVLSRRGVSPQSDSVSFSGGVRDLFGLRDKIDTKKENFWTRLRQWIVTTEYQAVPAVPRIEAPSPVSALTGETGTLYRLLEEYVGSVYSGRTGLGALDHYAAQLAKVDTAKLDDADKAYHLVFSHDVAWRQTMQAQRLKTGYDGRVLTREGHYRLGSPERWVERLIREKDNPFNRLGNLQRRPQKGIGKTIYDAILRHQLYAGKSSDAMITRARADYDQWLARMNDLAKEIDPKAKDWRDVYAQITEKHPQRDEVIATYKQEAEKASRFLRKHNLIDVPEGYTLRIEETPGYYRDSLPFAAYVPSRLTFWVTVTMNDDPATEDEQLRAHNYSDIKAVTVHEAFPGHHLDQVHKRAFGHQAKLDPADPRSSGRKFLLNSANWDSAPYSEGWGLYAETVMFDQGYYDNPADPKAEAADKLVALRAMLWRGARAFLDGQIHTNQITPDDAVDFLVENLVMPRERAEAEVNRYVENPGQVVSYYLGMTQFKDLWAKARAQNPELELKDFNNAMLRRMMPVPALGLEKYGVDISETNVAEAETKAHQLAGF